MPRGLDERFEQHGAIAVAVLPVMGQLPRGERQDLGGQAFGLEPRQDEESRVVDHPLPVAPLLRIVPADEALACGELPGTGTEAQQGGQPLAGEDVVALGFGVSPTWARTRGLRIYRRSWSTVRTRIHVISPRK